MHKLWHFRLCPFSRSIRLALSETGTLFTLVEERPWEWRPEFLSRNPAGEVPVLELADGPVICGAYAISEFLADDGRRISDASRTPSLFPGNREDRAEARRLVDWFHGKLHREVTREMLYEKVYARFSNAPEHRPDTDLLRALRVNLQYHLSYIGFLAYQRRWLAGDDLSFADLAAASHLSCLDYLAEVPWDEHPGVKEWYMRMKSRPALRALLAERVPGTPPPVHYTELDF
jgi:glutathione S-transferase